MVGDASYSPRLRTGVVLCGVGTAGAYHAGVWRALTESGVKVDVLAAHGAGVPTALCAAIDGGARLWDAAGPWTGARIRRAYTWRPALRIAATGLLAAGIILAAPLLVLVWAALVYAASLLAALVNLPDASAWLVGFYQRSIELLFNPPLIPTIVPRAMMLAVLVVAGVVVAAGVRAAAAERSRRRLRGAWWWRLLGSPLDSTEPAAVFVETLWALVRGASNAPAPVPAEIGRRFADILADNFGQPGFCEVVLAVHDVDARRDLVGALLPPDRLAAFTSRREGAGPREAECVDLGTAQRDLVVEFLVGAQRLPLASAPHVVRFAADGYWRGEEHRICDRPELAVRLIDELAGLGVEQVVLVGAAPVGAMPHGMRMRAVDLRGRAGEAIRSIETAVLQDAWAAASTRFSGVFVVRPDHNAIGPFDFAGSYDEASDRRRTMPELLQQGYQDAYRQFIEPVVASGERLGAIL
jgi:hypothetical protein